MADGNLNEFNIDLKYYFNNIDPFSFINNSQSGGDGASIETVDLSASSEFNKDYVYDTMSVYSDFEQKITSCDTWVIPPTFSKNDVTVFKIYINKYKEKTGIDLYDLSNYTFDELIKKGVFQQNGDIILDKEMIAQIMKEENSNLYSRYGDYGVDVFCAWAREKASINFVEETTIMNVKLSEIAKSVYNNKYVESVDENNVLATAESDAIIQTTNSIVNAIYTWDYTPVYDPIAVNMIERGNQINNNLSPVEVINPYELIGPITEYYGRNHFAQVFIEYIKNKNISELIDNDGKMHIDVNDLKQFVLKYNNEHPNDPFFADDDSITKATNNLAAKVNSLDIRYDSITEDRHINGTFGDLYNEEKKFSNASDYDQINLNRFNLNLTNDVKEVFGRDSNKYKVYCKFLEGKKLNDIIKDDHFVASKEDLMAAAEKAGVTLTNKEMYDMLSYFSKNSFRQYSDSATLRNLTIQKIISNESGYDSIIFEKDGEVIVTNTCADSLSKEDTCAIAYSAIKLLFGDNSTLYDFLSPAFVGTKATIPNLGADYADIPKAKSYYNRQIEESYQNVLSQLQAGKKVHINCYSLGGGTGFDTFMRIMSDDKIPDEYKINLTYSGYNPYLNMFEADSFFGDKDGHEAAVKKVFGKYGSQIKIRCVEGDAISQFNTVIDGELGKHITYIKAPDGAPLTLNDFDNSSEEHEGNIMDLITDGDSRHSLDTMDQNTFNNGYVIFEGKKITMNEMLGNSKPSNDLKDIYKGMISPYLDDFKNNNHSYANLIDALNDYLGDHVGEDIDYDGLIDAVMPSIVEISEKFVPGTLGKEFAGGEYDSRGIFRFCLGIMFGEISTFCNDDKTFSDILGSYFKSDEGKDTIIAILNLIANAKKDEDVSDDIMSILQPIIRDNYIKSFGKSPDLLSSY